MKKFVLSLFVLLLTPLSSLSFSSTLQDLNTSQVTQATDSNAILQKWFKETKISGKRIFTLNVLTFSWMKMVILKKFL